MRRADGRTCDANAHPDLSKTAGYRHESIPVAVEKLRGIAQVQSLRAVIFVNTTGDILDPEQQQALEGFIRAGGGFMGVHAAADTQYDWPWYGELVGAWFSSTHHAGAFAVDGTGEGPRMACHRRDPPLPAQSAWTGQVIATVDERDHPGGTPGRDHPIARCHRVDAGRAWHTAWDTTRRCTRTAFSCAISKVACAM